MTQTTTNWLDSFHAHEQCAYCGSGLAAAAIFCEDCGRPVEGTPLRDPIVVEDPRRRIPRRRWVVAGAVVAVVALLGAGVANAVGTRQRLDRTRDTLASTRTDLGDTKRQLTSTTSTLSDTRNKLSAALGDLDEAETELSGVRNTLSDANGRISSQAGQIETLKSCLNGITLALSLAADGNVTAAVAALRAVEVSCDAAYAML